jgi:hypothetical protein
LKQTGQIELAKGSLIPNKRELWYSTFEKFNEAKSGIQQMLKAQDRVSYESGWVRFVDSLEEAWTSFFHEGKTTFTNFQPWVAQITSKPRRSGLLKYLYESRHQSQHGNIALDWSAGKTRIAPNYYGHIKDLKVFSDQSFEVDANPLGNEYNKVTLVHSTGEPKLPTIDNRGSIYNSPTEHLGIKLSTGSPHMLANIAVNYYQDIFDKASQKFGEK